MADENKQWFEDNGRRRKRPTGKKRPEGKKTLPPEDHVKKEAQVIKQPSGKRNDRPVAGKKPSSASSSSSGASYTSGKPGKSSGNPRAGASSSAPSSASSSSSKASDKKKKHKKLVLKRKKKTIDTKKSTTASDSSYNSVTGAAVSGVAAAAASKTPITDAVIKKQRRAKKKAIRTAVFAVIVIALSVLVLRFVKYHLFNYIADKPNFSFVTTGTVEHTIGARALIVRDEQVIESGTAGDLVTMATEGSRVSVGQDVAMIVPSDMASVVTSLRGTQSQISEVQQELIMNGEAEGASSIYTSNNERILPIIDLIRVDAMNGNVSDLSSYQSSLSVLISQRESELSQLSFDDERLRILRSDEAGYQLQLERQSSVVNTPYTGIISYKLDGLENTVNYDYLINAPASDIANVISDSQGLITSDLYVDRSEPMARVASSERQYIAVYLDAGEVPPSEFEVGKKHTLNIRSEGISIGKCVVEREVVDSNGILIVFSTTRYVEDLLDLRTVDIEIVITETTGMRVPISSLVDADFDRRVASIYVNNKGFADSVGVLIVDYDREFAIIEPIGDDTRPNLTTVYITNPSSIKPGDKVD
ncbi:MAG: hypothetical protein J5685_03130 [Clostridiales bacterium]|nr:hypothetical protein [Clostridiales bacterium]